MTKANPIWRSHWSSLLSGAQRRETFWAKLSLESAQNSLWSALVFHFLTWVVLRVILILRPLPANDSSLEPLSKAGKAHSAVNPGCTSIPWGASNPARWCLSSTPKSSDELVWGGAWTSVFCKSNAGDSNRAKGSKVEKLYARGLRRTAQAQARWYSRVGQCRQQCWGICSATTDTPTATEAKTEELRWAGRMPEKEETTLLS